MLAPPTYIFNLAGIQAMVEPRASSSTVDNIVQRIEAMGTAHVSLLRVGKAVRDEVWPDFPMDMQAVLDEMDGKPEALHRQESVQQQVLAEKVLVMTAKLLEGFDAPGDGNAAQLVLRIVDKVLRGIMLPPDERAVGVWDVPSCDANAAVRVGFVLACGMAMSGHAAHSSKFFASDSPEYLGDSLLCEGLVVWHLLIVNNMASSVGEMAADGTQRAFLERCCRLADAAASTSFIIMKLEDVRAAAVSLRAMVLDQHLRSRERLPDILKVIEEATCDLTKTRDMQVTPRRCCVQ